MKNWKHCTAALLALLAMLVWVPPAPASALSKLKAAAQKEGVIQFYGPSTLTPAGAQALDKAFNKMYGLHVRLVYNPSGNMVRDVSTIVSQSMTGIPPQWDLMVVTDAHWGELSDHKLAIPYDYRKLGVPAKLIHYDDGTVSFLNQIVLPAYNTKILPAKDVPKTWFDLLKPEFKDGKIGVNTATHHYARLAFGPWGKAKTTRFVKALAAQKPMLGRLGEMYSKLITGEILISATLTDSYMGRAELKGAPLAFANVQPVIVPAYDAGVLKGAAHPALAHLFAAFLASPASQKIWYHYTRQSSALVPGTHDYDYVQGKEAIYMKDSEAKEISHLAREYGRILGFP